MKKATSKVRNFVTFRSEFFFVNDAYDPAIQIFPGEVLGEFLVAELNTMGYPSTEPDLDDFAWTFEVRVGKHRFWIHLNESGEATPYEWLLIVNSTTGWLRRLRIGSDEASMQSLCDAIGHILDRDERIEEIAWCTEVEWDAGVVET